MVIKVGILPHIPVSIHNGGFERSAGILYDAMRRSNRLAIDTVNWLQSDADFDVLHLFGGSSNWYDIAYHFPGRLRLVVTALGAQSPFGLSAFLKSHSLSFINHLTVNRTVHDRTAFVLNRADAVICLSDVEKYFLCSRYRIKEQNVHIIPNAVPDNWLDNVEHAKSKASLILPKRFRQGYILFIGTITKRKNPLKLIRASRLLNLPILIIGKATVSEADYYAEVREELDSQKDSSMYIEEVAYGSSEHKGLIACSSILCLPSSHETQPLVLLEGLALGRQSVCGNGFYSRQGLFNRVWKCNPRSVTSIASTIAEALASAPLPRIGSIISHTEAGNLHADLYESLFK